jgi:hypothetical protein
MAIISLPPIYFSQSYDRMQSITRALGGALRGVKTFQGTVPWDGHALMLYSAEKKMRGRGRFPII